VVGGRVWGGCVGGVGGVSREVVVVGGGGGGVGVKVWGGRRCGFDIFGDCGLWVLGEGCVCFGVGAGSFVLGERVWFCGMGWGVGWFFWLGGGNCWLFVWL